MKLDKSVITISFTGEINEENYFIFEEELNKARRMSKKVILYFSTFGGEMILSEQLIDIINDYPFELEMRCFGYLFSAGLLIIAKLKKPIIIDIQCVGLVHIPSIALESRNTKKKTGFETYMTENEDNFNGYYLRGIKHVLSEEELELVLNGEDVCLGKDRIDKIVKGDA